MVSDRSIPQSRIGGHQIKPVNRLHFRSEQSYLDDEPLDCAGLDIFTHPKRTKDEKHDTGGYVLKRSLKCQTDRKAGRSKSGEKRRRLDTELTEHGDEDENEQSIMDETLEEAGQRLVNAMDARQTPGAPSTD